MSRATVSRSFSNGLVNPSTKRSVMLAAKRLGYRPNALARGLITKRSHLIALIINNICNPREAESYDALVESLRNQSLVPLILSKSRDDDLAEVAQGLAGYQVDAAIVFADNVSVRKTKKAFGIEYPIMCNGWNEDSSYSVIHDDSSAIDELVNTLLDHGSKKIAYITGRAESNHSANRYLSARKALQKRGMDFCNSESGNFVYEGGASAAKMLLTNEPDIDTLICANDAMAMGAIDTATRLFGRKISVDIAITGYDNIEMASWPAFDLTTIAISSQEEATSIGKCINASIGGGRLLPKSFALDGKVIWRGSTWRTESKR